MKTNVEVLMQGMDGACCCQEGYSCSMVEVPVIWSEVYQWLRKSADYELAVQKFIIMMCCSHVCVRRM